MHWVALHFPQLRRQALSRGHAPPEPEREALEAAAAWAGGFSSRVSLEPPQALLLEAGGSLRRFGGRWRFLARLREGLSRLGFEARIGEAASARAALWLARGNGGRLEAQSTAVLDLAPQAQALLSSLGVHTVGGLMRLPRDGIALRFGPKLLEEIDQAMGRATEAREAFVPPPRFSSRLLLPAPVAQAERALFAVRRLLEQLEGFLAARQAGVRAFSLLLLHQGRPATEVRLGLAGPSRDKEHFTGLLRDRLGALVLKAPIEAIRLEADALEVLPGKSGSLLHDATSGGEDWARLAERLGARLGSGRVHGVDVHPAHRPEQAWRPVLPGAAFSSGPPPAVPPPRPVWLLDPPRRIAEGEFALLAGPERIESGWWDGAEACRDYFVARTGESSLAWIYREREGNWFLHGYFA
jgi:protein ImuB